MDHQQVLVDHLPLVDRIVQVIARRHRLPAADADEFSSLVRYRLLDKDYAVLRKFEGRSSLSTYLTTVIERLFLDYCDARWGKWRPSVAARRLGPVAAHLERLLVRDRLTFDEAVGTLQTTYHVVESREALHALYEQLPVRANRRWGGEDELAQMAGQLGVRDTAHELADDSALVARVELALHDVLGTFPERDQLLLKLRFHDDLPLAQVARLLGEDPKPLYRKMLTLLTRFREALLERGLDESSIRRVVGHPAITMRGIFEMHPLE